MSSYFSVIVLIVIACLSRNHHAALLGRAVRIDIYNNKAFRDRTYLAEDPSKSESLVQCTQRCRVREACMSLSYNSITHECITFTTSYYATVNIVPELGWAYYFYGGNACPVNEAFTLDRVSKLCFFVLTSASTFAEAQTKCQQYHNASIVSLDTAEKVLSLARVMNVVDITLPPLRIGLSSNDGGVSWTWTSGVALNTKHANWEPGQPKCPTTGGCDCVELVEKSWQWRVECCQIDRIAICEYRMD